MEQNKAMFIIIAYTIFSVLENIKKYYMNNHITFEATLMHA